MVKFQDEMMTDAIPALERIKTIDATPQSTYADTKISRSLPSPSLQRKKESLTETPFNLHSPADEPLHEIGDGPDPKTIFYLAYGSNLCAETFQGKRKIRPLSQANVVVPELVMTFDLPGLPYLEPCYANTRYRKSTEHSAMVDDEKASLLSPSPSTRNYRKPLWGKGLVGVVYEVTTENYARIIASEGGGSSYQDILVDCYDLPAGGDLVPAQPTSQPFKAHTLYSPASAPGVIAPHSGRLSRPDPDYAEPTKRYLKLINDGANEHALPGEYKAYLRQLRPYVITTTRQKIGQAVYMMAWIPIVTVIFRLNALFADKRGRTPSWLRILLSTIFNSCWISYDWIFKGLFGDGERTIGDGEDNSESHSKEEKPGVTSRSN